MTSAASWERLEFQEEVSSRFGKQDSGFKGGVFTCPTSGLYLFIVTITVHQTPENVMDSSLTVNLRRNNNQIIYNILSINTICGSDEKHSFSIILRLEKDEVIDVVAYGTPNFHIIGNRDSVKTSFSGALVFR